VKTEQVAISVLGALGNSVSTSPSFSGKSERAGADVKVRKGADLLLGYRTRSRQLQEAVPCHCEEKASAIFFVNNHRHGMSKHTEETNLRRSMAGIFWP
jgi:hypothetical protein